MKNIFLAVVGSVIIAGGYVFGMNQVDAISRRHTHDQAVQFCMQWRIPDAIVIDGELYCKTAVLQTLPTGIAIIMPQLWSEKEMNEIFKAWKISEEFNETP